MSPKAASGAKRSRPADPVAEIRHRLATLGVDIEPLSGTRDPKPVRSGAGGSAEPDSAGTRSSDPDPQRARSTGFTPPARQSGGRRRRSSDSLFGDGESAGARRPRRNRGPHSADPVAAGSEGNGPEPGTDSGRPRKDRTPQGGTVEQAKEACLRLLAVRARSRAELAQRLAAKGYTPEITEQALSRLTDVGLVDDAAFAEEWVHARHTFSGKGKQALAQELRRKGVSRADSAPALEAITSDDETSRAIDLVRRKLRSMPATLDREKTIRRLVGMLARRGYSQSIAFTVVKAELAERDNPDSDPEDWASAD
ncbi:hypothetical protein GCM10027088_08720 [Nocardia goodfellowii]